MGKENKSLMDRVLTASYNVLKKTPAGLVTRGLEKKFGQMNDINRGLVSFGYTLSALIYTHAAINFYKGFTPVAVYESIASSCLLVCCALHQSAMGRKKRNVKN